MAGAVLAAACSSDGGDDRAASTSSTTVAETSTTTTAAPEPEPAIVVEVLDAGAEPRRELRFRAPAGTTDQVRQRQTISLTQQVDGREQQVPTAPSEIVSVYTLRGDGGPRTLDVTFEEATATDAPGVPDEVVAETQRLLDALEGAEGRLQVDERGIVGGAEFGIDVTGNPTFDQFIASFEDQAQQLALPFPEEAVGVGARWRATSEVELTGIPLETVTTIELVRVDGPDLVADIVVDVTFVPGVVTAQGQRVEVVEGTLRGVGTATWNLDTQLVPRFEQTATGTTTLRIQGRELVQEQSQTTVIEDA